MRIVICGGGVISACTAYFLKRRGVEVIVVERTEVATLPPAKLAASSRSTGVPAHRSMR